MRVGLVSGCSKGTRNARGAGGRTTLASWPRMDDEGPAGTKRHGVPGGGWVRASVQPAHRQREEEASTSICSQPPTCACLRRFCRLLRLPTAARGCQVGGGIPNAVLTARA